MKIAVFGFYHALNYGDDRLQYCITRLINTHQNSTICFIPHYVEPSVAYINTFDWILIGGGGLVFKEVGIWKNTSRWLLWCTAKIGVIGIGINALPGNLESHINDLIEKSVFFFVRDQESKKKLSNHPKVKVFPDLSWCFPIKYFSATGSKSMNFSRIIAFNLLPIHWGDFNYEPQKWYQSALGNVNGYQLKPLPLNFRQGQDYDLMKSLFGDQEISTEFDISLVSESKLVVACRFHAIIFAMQLRKPFIAINYDKKIARLIQESQLNELMLNLDEYRSLPQKIGYIEDNYDDIVSRITLFSDVQEKLAQEMASEFHGHIKNEMSTDYSIYDKAFLKIKKKISIYIS